jgi:small-conductance mechanosensitive channel
LLPIPAMVVMSMVFLEQPSVFATLVAVAIVLASVGVGILFYLVVRRSLLRLALKTESQLDNMLIAALEWPIIVGAILSGMYLGVVSLPFVPDIDSEIRRGFHVAYIAFGGWTVVSVLDAAYRWFKLEITPKTNTALDDWIISLLRLATPVIVVVTLAVFSLELYGIDMSMIRNWLSEHGSRIGLVVVLSVAALFILGVAGTKAVSSVVVRGSAGQPEEEVRKRIDTLSGVLITAGQVFIIVTSGFVVLSEFNINIAPILAGASVVGVALGFGAQTLVKDIIAGFFVVMENQYRVGDVVEVAGINGLVMEISLRRTVLRDIDGTVHVVPNGEIKVASNKTKGFSRVNLDISVSYDTDLDRAISVINRVCKQMAEEQEWAPLIIKAPEVLWVEKLGDSGIDLKVLGETKPTQQWTVAGEIRKRIKRAFDEEGIEIPWPHTKVYFGNSPLPREADAGPGHADSKTKE